MPHPRSRQPQMTAPEQWVLDVGLCLESKDPKKLTLMWDQLNNASPPHPQSRWDWFQFSQCVDGSLCKLVREGELQWIEDFLNHPVYQKRMSSPLHIHQASSALIIACQRENMDILKLMASVSSLDQLSDAISRQLSLTRMSNNEQNILAHLVQCLPDEKNLSEAELSSMHKTYFNSTFGNDSKGDQESLVLLCTKLNPLRLIKGHFPGPIKPLSSDEDPPLSSQNLRHLDTLLSLVKPSHQTPMPSVYPDTIRWLSHPLCLPYAPFTQSVLKAQMLKECEAANLTPKAPKIKKL